jgi:hypothetical protein
MPVKVSGISVSLRILSGSFGLDHPHGGLGGNDEHDTWGVYHAYPFETRIDTGDEGN